MIEKRPLVIGRAEVVDFPELQLADVPARIDTGAKTSSMWVSSVTEEGGVLQVVFLGPQQSLYTGLPVRFTDYGTTVVASSNGQTQLRYKVRLAVRLHGRRIRASFTLADRSTQTYPVLIGRNVLRGKFIVDVKKGTVQYKAERQRTAELQSAIEPDNEEGI